MARRLCCAGQRMETAQAEHSGTACKIRRFTATGPRAVNWGLGSRVVRPRPAGPARPGPFLRNAKCQEEKNAHQKTTGCEHSIGFAGLTQSTLKSLSHGNTRKRLRRSLEWI